MEILKIADSHLYFSPLQSAKVATIQREYKFLIKKKKW
jgi:hypothetical protein